VDDEASPEARARFQKMLGDLLTVQSSLSGLSQYAGSPGDLAYLRERLSHAQEDLMIFVFGPRWDAEEREKRTAAEHAAKLEKDLCYVGRRG
jgi:hypothetical protein